MFILRLFALICFVSAAIIYPSHADVYKWRDSEGKLRYSDIPPKSDVKYEVLSKKKDASLASNPAPKNTTKLDVPATITLDTKNAKEATGISNSKYDKIKENAEKLNPPTLNDNSASIKEENCKAAKSNYATYKNGGRIKRINEKGQPEFLNDADIASARASAQKDVDNFCNS